MSYIGTTEIGKMFLGSVEIDKAYLGNDLVFSNDGATPVNPGDISNYVQDGLVLHLDGIDKGATSNRWSSLVGSTYFTLTSHSTSESNAVLMDGSGALSATNPVKTTMTAGTIEVCCNVFSTGSCAIYYGPSNSLAFVIGGAGYTFGMASSSNQWNVTKASLFTASANNDRFVFNGVATGTKASNSWTANGSNVYTIGGRASGTNRYYANARIYSIRIYSRKLTEAEMLNNQKVDNARFNLGLNVQ